MLMSLPSLFVFPVHFLGLFSQKQQKRVFLFLSLSGMNIVFPPTNNPLMKYSSYFPRKFLHLSLFVFL